MKKQMSRLELEIEIAYVRNFIEVIPNMREKGEAKIANLQAELAKLTAVSK